MKSSQQSGFSLVEMIVSLGVFSVVITIAVGALLLMVASNSQLQQEQGVMTNLSFALDSMTREIRTGSNYFCISDDALGDGAAGERIFDDGEPLNAAVWNDCKDGKYDDIHGISFIESGQSITGAENTRIVYFFYNNQIFRRISGQNAQSVVSSGIYIENAEFYVTGSDPLSNNDDNDDQAMVTIFIEARDASDPAAKTYQIQTTVTQRSLDI